MPAVVVPLITWNPQTDSEWSLRGTKRDGSPVTWEDCFAFALREWYSRPEKSPKVRWTVDHVRKLCHAARPPLPAQPSPGNIMGLIEWMRSQYAPGTVHLYWRQLRTVFELASRAGFARGNPAWPLHLDKPGGAPHHINDIRAKWPLMLGACATPRERLFIALQRYALLRRGEALAVKARDIIRGKDGPDLCVRRQRVTPNAWTTKPTKGKRARTLPVHPELAELLEVVLELGPAVVLNGMGGQREEESPFLCPFREDDLTDFGNRLREVVPDAFPRGRKMWHALRDTGAIEMYENGADLGLIRDMLGHSTEVVTFTSYMDQMAAARVPRSALRFVGASCPPQGAGPPVAVSAASSGRKRTAAVGAAAVQERSTKQSNQRGQEATCSTPRARAGSESSRRDTRPRGASVATRGTSTSGSAGRGGPAGERAGRRAASAAGGSSTGQRALPGLAAVAVTTRPARAAARTRARGRK